MQQCLNAALDMARRGFRIFPCVPYGKRPAFDGWSDAATTDEGQIRQWFAERPDYNYGVLTNDRVVADVDTHKIGQEALDNYAKLGGHWDTFTVQSPTGGYHAYFEGPDSGLRAGLLPGIDIRSHNGYVVGPGSYTDPARTTDPSVKAAGYYTVLVDTDLAWCPVAIELQLRPPGKRLERLDASVELDTPTAVANARVWLAAAPPAIEGQGGDNRTYETAAKLVRDYGLTVQTAYDMLLELWNERCVPPWPTDLLFAKVENAYEYGTAVVGSARPEATFGEINVPPIPADTFEHQAVDLGLYMGNALEPVALEPRAWAVERLLMRGDVTVIAATGSGGKSMFKLSLAAHFACGQDFGIYKLKNKGVPQRIFVYNAEDDIPEQSRRLLALCHHYKLDYPTVRSNIMLMDDRFGELILATADNNVPHENYQATKFLTETFITNAIDMFFLDPLLNLHHMQENNPVHMRFLVTVVRKLARATNSSAMLAHHTSKGGNSADKGSAEAIRGSGAIVNSARIAVMLSGPEDDDLNKLGISKEHRHSYVRIDDAKANMFLRAGHAAMWMKWHSVKIATGDLIGVPEIIEFDAAKNAERQKVAEAIYAEFMVTGQSSCSVADGVRILRKADPLYDAMCQSNEVSLRRLVQNHLMHAVDLADGASIVLSTDLKKAPIIKII